MPPTNNKEGGSYRAHIPMHIAEALGEKIKKSSPTLTIRDAVIHACLNYLSSAPVAPPPQIPPDPTKSESELDRSRDKNKNAKDSLFSEFDDFLDD